MAMMACPECGKDVSSMAPACPGCGCPINAPKTQEHVQTIEQTGKSNKAVTVVCFLVILFGALYSIPQCGRLGQGVEGWTGPVIMGVGVIVYMINKISIWWHHE